MEGWDFLGQGLEGKCFVKNNRVRKVWFFKLSKRRIKLHNKIFDNKIIYIGKINGHHVTERDYIFSTGIPTIKEIKTFLKSKGFIYKNGLCYHKKYRVWIFDVCRSNIIKNGDTLYFFDENYYGVFFKLFEIIYLKIIL
jgi:hypothetical protein